MAMSLIHRGVCGQAVEIALTFHVVNPNALRAFHNYIERVVVVGSKLIFQLYEILSAHTFF
jgi:hypothetical protein